MTIPAFSANGLLPPNDGTYWSGSADEIRERFAAPHAHRTRLDCWSGFMSLVDLVGHMLGAASYPVEWWLHGRFVTAAEECPLLDAVAILPQEGVEALPGCYRDFLERINDSSVGGVAYNTDVELVFADPRGEVSQLQADLAQARARCSRNRLDESDPLVDAGWVALI